MSNNGEYQRIAIDDIVLDESNPRIAHFLEHKEPPYSDDDIRMALETGGDDDDRTGASFSKLKQSIQTSGGIIQPVILEKRADGKYRCIEGNTRVFLYRDFREKGTYGAWETIPAIVHSEIDEAEVHSIRLQAHLVGPRQWDPYSKAKYLHFLRNHDRLPFSELVDLCGGNERSIRDSLAAYEDMEEYYRPLVGDENFEPRRFSGFVELQKGGVKRALFEANLTEVDFSQWIAERRIGPLQEVRSLPAILKDSRARKIFLEEGFDEAQKALDRPQLSKALEDADVDSLCRALKQAIDNMPFHVFSGLKDNPSLPSVQYLQDLQETVDDFLTRLELN